MGKSDHDGCNASTSASRRSASGTSASSARITAPAPSRIAAQSTSIPSQTTLVISTARRIFCVISASTPKSAKTSTRSSVGLVPLAIAFPKEGTGRAGVVGSSGQHAVEIAERFADLDAASAQRELTERFLVRTVSLFHHGDGVAHAPARLEEAEKDDAVRQVARVDR